MKYMQQRNRVSVESHQNRTSQIGKIFHFRNGEQSRTPTRICSTEKIIQSIPRDFLQAVLKYPLGNLSEGVQRQPMVAQTMEIKIKMGPKYTKSISLLTIVSLIFYFMMRILQGVREGFEYDFWST